MQQTVQAWAAATAQTRDESIHMQHTRAACAPADVVIEALQVVAELSAPCVTQCLLPLIRLAVTQLPQLLLSQGPRHTAGRRRGATQHYAARCSTAAALPVAAA